MKMELKTLDDMNLYFSDRVKLEKEFLAYAEKNNIKNCPQSVIGWIQNKIRARDRQEAIKHLKYLEKGCELTIKPNELDRIYGKMDFINHFFNITEEDLK